MMMKQYMCQFNLIVFVMVIIYEKEATDAIYVVGMTACCWHAQLHTVHQEVEWAKRHTHVVQYRFLYPSLICCIICHYNEYVNVSKVQS